MSTFTNQTKTSASFNPVNKTGFAYWGDVDATWGDTLESWGGDPAVYTNATKNVSTFTPITKN